MKMTLYHLTGSARGNTQFIDADSVSFGREINAELPLTEPLMPVSTLSMRSSQSRMATRSFGTEAGSAPSSSTA